MPWDRELSIARAAALRAGELALVHRARGLDPEVKSDGSPVTAADRECEQLLARLLDEAFPDDGILGEEGARKDSRSGRRWILDPIDGTRDFVRGNPVWATLIGLEAGGQPVAGVAHFPALGETYCAAAGHGAYRNDQPIRVSSIPTVEQAVLCVNGFDTLALQPFAPRLLGWARRFWAVRAMGGAFDAMLLASGRAEIWIEPRVKEWDLAAPKIILEESGARFFSLDGRNTIYGGNAVACTPALEPALREFLQINKSPNQ
ncbi:MAG: histidinol phosphate phosphatase [Acidobacteria bacterium]|nr:histidinol phosphate phosphatase [Acidobacteriota bacterium]